MDGQVGKVEVTEVEVVLPGDQGPLACEDQVGQGHGLQPGQEQRHEQHAYQQPVQRRQQQ